MALRGGARTSSTAVFPKYRAVQVQIVHRHGDRTPITPLRNEEFWASTLISKPVLKKIERGTHLIRPDDEKVAHLAAGIGPFGKLTQKGLLQMIQVGTQIRDELVLDHTTDHPPELPNYQGHLWGPTRPLRPQDIRVLSTNFPRTIQSVQGVLVGFFPESPDDEMIQIDCRHTNWMIPDPQPRSTREQQELELQLALRPHVVQRDAKMLPLAKRCTEAIRPLLGAGAFDVTFGVGEDGKDAVDDPKDRVLPWAQLAEITKCLKDRDLLPASLTVQDQEALSDHTAWKWFESLRHPRLAYLAMNQFTHHVLHSMKHHATDPALTIYSAHDSTLIGLLCAFRLEQPTVWPEYGSYLKMELLEMTESEDGDEKRFVVRFYLNGKLLRSQWNGELRDEIALEQLTHFMANEGAGKGTN